MGKRAKRSAREVYERKFVGFARCPNGKRWTKPSAMKEVLESAVITERSLCVAPLYDWVKRASDTPVSYGKGHGSKNLKFGKTRDSGNVFLEYAWSRFNLHGEILTERDVMAALSSGRVQAWYDRLCGPQEGQTVKVEMSAECNDLDKLKKRARRKRKAETQEERWARIGNEHRESLAKGRAEQAEKAEALKAQIESDNATRELAAKFRRMLKG